jgi:hypothetical protein
MISGLAFSGARFYENTAKLANGARGCVICGKAVTRPVHWVHVHGGGALIVTSDEADLLNADPDGPAADMAFFVVGPECLRTRPFLRSYVTSAPGA